MAASRATRPSEGAADLRWRARGPSRKLAAASMEAGIRSKRDLFGAVSTSPMPEFFELVGIGQLW